MRFKVPGQKVIVMMLAFLHMLDTAMILFTNYIGDSWYQYRCPKVSKVPNTDWDGVNEVPLLQGNLKKWYARFAPLLSGNGVQGPWTYLRWFLGGRVQNYPCTGGAKLGVKKKFHQN